MNIDYIKAQLQRRLHERQLSKVSTGAGVSRRTLYRIIEGGNTTQSTLVALDKYLRHTERQKKLTGGKE